LPADGTEPVIMLSVKHQVGFQIKTLQATSNPHLHHAPHLPFLICWLL